MTPSYIRSKGIPVHVVRQCPGDLVITSPEGLHAGTNLGTNIAEAINHAQPFWLDIGLERQHCTCGLWYVRDAAHMEPPLRMLVNGDAEDQGEALDRRQKWTDTRVVRAEKVEARARQAVELALRNEKRL